MGGAFAEMILGELGPKDCRIWEWDQDVGLSSFVLGMGLGWLPKAPNSTRRGCSRSESKPNPLTPFPFLSY